MLSLLLAGLAMFVAQNVVVAVVVMSPSLDGKVPAAPPPAKQTTEADPTSVMDSCPEQFQPSERPPQQHHNDDRREDARWLWRLCDVAIGASVAAAVQLTGRLCLRRLRLKPRLRDTATQTQPRTVSWASASSDGTTQTACAKPIADEAAGAGAAAIGPMDSVTSASADSTPPSSGGSSDGGWGGAADGAWDGGATLVWTASAQWDALRECLSKARQCVSDSPAIKAASRLVNRRAAVLCDLTTPLPKSQLQLKRINATTPETVQCADQALREVTRRLLGRAGVYAKGVAPAELLGPQQAQVWCDTAAYLTQRTQGRPEECPGRDVDMGEAEAAVFKQELQAVYWQAYKALAARLGAPASPRLRGEAGLADATVSEGLGLREDEVSTPPGWEGLLGQLGREEGEAR